MIWIDFFEIEKNEILYEYFSKGLYNTNWRVFFILFYFNFGNFKMCAKFVEFLKFYYWFYESLWTNARSTYYYFFENYIKYEITGSQTTFNARFTNERVKNTKKTCTKYKKRRIWHSDEFVFIRSFVLTFSLSICKILV